MSDIIWMKTTTDPENYICSVVNTPDGYDYIKAIREDVQGSDKRVVLRGRLGKNNPNAHKYKYSSQDIKLIDSAHIDVYLRYK